MSGPEEEWCSTMPLTMPSHSGRNTTKSLAWEDGETGMKRRVRTSSGKMGKLSVTRVRESVGITVINMTFWSSTGTQHTPSPVDFRRDGCMPGMSSTVSCADPAKTCTSWPLPTALLCRMEPGGMNRSCLQSVTEREEFSTPFSDMLEAKSLLRPWNVSVLS